VLTADLVGARRRGDELRLIPVDDGRRARIETLAAVFAGIARTHVGATRAELDGALESAAADADGPGADRRLTAAVQKLVYDGCRFEEPDAEAAAAVRRDVFRRAAAARRAASPSAPFQRGAVLEGAARERATTATAIEAGLYADRPARQGLLAFEGRPAGAIAAGFELAEAQAVLLRATRVTAQVRARDAGTYRHLFRTLKVLRLLATIEPTAKGGYAITLDGPLSLFQGGTRYGLQLGLALPAIAACDSWSIEADVRWGNDRRPLRFRIGGGAPAIGSDGVPIKGAAVASDGHPPPPLPDELAAFVAAFEKLESGWRIDREPAVLDLPGAGVCVPDLAFVRARDRARVHFELLGFWSRETVWRRVELVRAGLPHRILFAVSKTLRVGEAVLDETPTAALYVFSRVIAAKQVLDRLDRLADAAT
jgi:predicted nuclease of restriction endonuclease-like RecB superfamily